MATPTALVQLHNITKSFGATKAVKGVSVDLPAAQIIGLVGENGAGKSTLAKMIAGIYTPDFGTIEFDGSEVNFKSPYEAINTGVAMMAQEIMLIPDATVENNIFMGDLPSRGPFPDQKKIREEFNKLNDLTGFALRPDVKVSSLRLADQQKVEIMRSIARNTKMIIMDEPSASLTTDEVDRLHNTIRELVKRGVTILLISHFLEEVLSLTETVLIMRDGELVRSGPTSLESVDSLVSGLVGHSLETRYVESESVRSNALRLKVSGISTATALTDISLEIHEGEILGLAGLIGSGRTEIARAIFGADRTIAGVIEIDGKQCKFKSPADAISAGIYMVPESRKEEGLFLAASISDNMMASTFKKRATFNFISKNKLSKSAVTLAEKVDLRYSNIQQSAVSLSGGNQQKILFGRAVEIAPKILIVDEPTRGVDIAAKRAIHETLVDIAKQGTAILFISSEIEEVLGVCDRVLVIHRGRVQDEFKAPFDQTAVVAAFFGQTTGETDD
jgi:simple sugar transport system ATP-binding protein/ribose transport system ATP-binding protein